MTGQKSQGHLASARFHLKKKIIVIHLPSVSAVAILGFLASTAPFQVLLGRISLKTTPPVFLIHQIDFITLMAPVIKQ